MFVSNGLLAMVRVVATANLAVNRPHGWHPRPPMVESRAKKNTTAKLPGSREEIGLRSEPQELFVKPLLQNSPLDPGIHDVDSSGKTSGERFPASLHIPFLTDVTWNLLLRFSSVEKPMQS
jgi:hypothetical protein